MKGVAIGRRAWAPSACAAQGDKVPGARRHCQACLTALECAHRVRAVRIEHVHCALDPVFVFWVTVHEHCSLTLFMDTVH